MKLTHLATLEHAHDMRLLNPSTDLLCRGLVIRQAKAGHGLWNIAGAWWEGQGGTA